MLFSSRITLSLCALGFSSMVTLAWASDGGIGAASLADHQANLQSYLFPLICIICVVCWMFTFFRTGDNLYFFSSRILLSFTSFVFGIFVINSLLYYNLIEPVDLDVLPIWKYYAYIAGATCFTLLWFTTYFKVRGLIARQGTSHTPN